MRLAAACTSHDSRQATPTLQGSTGPTQRDYWLVSRPGSEFAYGNASSHLLSAIVAAVTGQPTLAYAQARLFGPLGIAAGQAVAPTIRQWPPTPAQDKAYEQAQVAWPIDPQGYPMGFGFVKLAARDLAKFGFLYLNRAVGTAARMGSPASGSRSSRPGFGGGPDQRRRPGTR